MKKSAKTIELKFERTIPASPSEVLRCVAESQDSWEPLEHS
jgi:hypothetical protein